MPHPSIEIAIRLAEQAQRSGLLADAETLCREVLAQQPQHPEALRLLGVVCRKSGRLIEAVPFIRASLATGPANPLGYRDLGDALRSGAKLDEAAAAYRKAIELRPDWAEVHGALGNTLKDQGKLDQAIDAYNKAIQLKPTLATAHLRLGQALHEKGRRTQATAAISQAIQLKSDFAEAFNSLGNVLWDDAKLDDAAAAYAKAVQLQPGYPEANWSMGKILARQGRLQEAIACFQKVVLFHPTNAMAHLNLARMLRNAAQLEQAAAAYRQAIQLQPDRPDWRFELAACSGDSSMTTVPDSYIQKLFDAYAPTYDQHLLKNLDYRVPQELLDAVLAATPRRRFDAALDLGCGTGLCGQLLRSYARELIGVDLSEQMIKAAEQRGVYDQLLHGDLISALAAEPDHYDLIVAGDVLVYVGDLSRLMPAIAAALRPGGLFAFSIEHYDGPGFFLHGRERFAHSMDYIRDTAAGAGLREVSAIQVQLRRQTDAQTPGWIVVLQKETQSGT
jgi:predicted TPR repeat methyltransferase